MKHFRLVPAVSLFAALTWLAGCAHAPATNSDSQPVMNAAGLDPVSTALLARDEFESVRMSKGGKYLAVASMRGSTPTVSVLERATKKLLFTRGMPDNFHVKSLIWIGDDKLSVYVIHTQGYLINKRSYEYVYTMNFDGTDHHQVFPEAKSGPNYNASVSLTGIWTSVASDQLVEGHYLILAEHNPGNAMGVEQRLKLLDLYNGRRRSFESLPMRFGDFALDNSGVVRAAYRVDDDLKMTFHTRNTKSGSWNPPSQWPMKVDDLEFLGFSPDNQTIFIESANMNGMNSLFSASLDDNGKMGKLNELASGDKFDINARWDRDDHEALFVDSMGPEANRKYVSQSAKAKVLAELDKSFPGERVFLVDSAPDALLLQVLSPSRPRTFYIFDQKSYSVSRLFAVNENVTADMSSGFKAVEYKARDGQTITGYLYQPKTVKGPLPLVISIHGGPYGVFDRSYFDGETQAMVARGYAVLTVNFRGSGGRGTKFIEAGYRKWGTSMQDDIADGAQWAVKSGFATAGKICLYGGSYGGYAAVMGMLKYPGLYKCAVGFAGVYDLRLIGKVGDQMNSDYLSNFFRRALPPTDQEKLAQSPISLAGALKGGLLLVHGALDDRVPVDHARAMKAALESAGKDFKYVEVADEGHGLLDQNRKYEMYAEIFKFFDANLK